MQENSLSASAPRFHGSSLDQMIAALTQGFGAFDAWGTSASMSFEWKADFWSDGKTSLISNQDHGGWAARTSPQTPMSLSFVLPRAGGLNITRGSRSIVGHPRQLMLINNHEFDHISVPTGFHRSDSISLDWSLIAQAVSALLEAPLIGSMDFSPVVDLSTANGQFFGSLAETIIVGMRNNGPLFHSPIAMSNLTQALIDLVIRLVPNKLSKLLERKIHLIAPWHVRRAIDFMHSNIGQPFTIQTVAETVGVSIRALEIGFRDFKGTTPSGYLRTIRLQAARNDLLDPTNERSVRAVALNWGFFHFGRFASIYRDAYGENPSDTRKRSRV